MKATAVLETCLYVNDLQQAERFYTDVLGLELFERKQDRHVFLRCGNQMVLLFNPQTTSVEKREPQGRIGNPGGHGAFGPGHCAFAVTEQELPEWRTWLCAKSVLIDSEVIWPNGGRSIYFRDPAGNQLEVATRKLWRIPEA